MKSTIKFAIVKNEKREDMVCPLCGGEVYHIQVNSFEDGGAEECQSYLWLCDECPMAMVEFYKERDTQALDYILNSPRR